METAVSAVSVHAVASSSEEIEKGVAASRRQVEQKLHAGISARQSIRRWVSGTLLVISLVLRGSCYAAELIAFSDGVMGHCLAHTVSWALSVFALIALSAAPLQDDARLTRVVIGVHICVTATQIYFLIDGFWDEADGLLADEAKVMFGMSLDTLAWVLVDSLFISFLLLAMVGREAADIQLGLWRSLQAFFVMSVALNLILHLHHLSECSCCLLYVLPDTVGLAVSLWPGFRGRVHNKLAQIYDRHSAKAAAASIAGLMGDCTINEVMGQAAARFRMIRADKILKEDLEKKDPDPLLYQRSQPARLGSCDAFVSHSWSDDAEGKWKAFEQWRDEFFSKNRRQPTVWLDKCCIDQTNIETDLRCLPIFLGGCNELVVLCGATYFTRLWCIVELFTHNHLQGIGSTNLTVVPVLSRGRTRRDLDIVTKAVSNFDVKQSECSSPKDRGRIMEIILASFSSHASFNQVVREVLHSSNFKQSLSCERSRAVTEAVLSSNFSENFGTVADTV
jgi:hypothetical protein